jgi:hypothetical protein
VGGDLAEVAVEFLLLGVEPKAPRGARVPGGGRGWHVLVVELDGVSISGYGGPEAIEEDEVAEGEVENVGEGLEGGEGVH